MLARMATNEITHPINSLHVQLAVKRNQPIVTGQLLDCGWWSRQLPGDDGCLRWAELASNCANRTNLKARSRRVGSITGTGLSVKSLVDFDESCVHEL